MHRSAIPCLGICLVPCLAMSLGLAAEDQSPSNEPIDVVDVNATHLGLDIEDQPYAIYRLDKTEIDFRNNRTLTDSLHNTPGVAMQKTGHSQASPFIRGLTGQQTLLLFDGVRLNHSMMRGGPNQYAAVIPKQSIANVDIILGGASAILGSDGLTGSIDFRLAEPGRSQQDSIGGYAEVRYGTADNGGSFATGFDAQSGDWAYTFEASLDHFGNVEGGKDAGDNLFGSAANDSEIPNTEYDQTALSGRFMYSGFTDQRIEVALGKTQQTDGLRPDGYFENSGVDGRISRYYPDQDFTYLHLHHFWHPQTGPIDQLKTTLWRHEHEEFQIREEIQNVSTVTERYRRREYDDAITTLGLEIQAQQTVNMMHALTYGAQTYSESTATGFKEFRSPSGDTDPDNATQTVFTDTQADARATVPDDADYNGQAIYVQDLWQMNETWNLLTGLRYSRFDWKADVTDRGFADDVIDNDTSALTAQIRASWTDQEHLKGFFGISQGFRAPNLNDLVGSEGAGSSGFVFAGNPDLDPETSISYEVGARYEINDEHHSYYALNLFVTQIDDMISRAFKDIDNDTILDAITENGDQATIQGFEFYFDHALPIFDTDGTFSIYSVTNYVDAEQTIQLSDGSSYDDNISRANRLQGVIGLKFEHVRQWWTAFQMRWSTDYDDVAEGDPSISTDGDASDVRLTVPGDATGAMDGYAVFDLKAGWHNADETQVYQVMLENLLDDTYRELGSGADSAGFNLVVSAQFKF